MLRGAGSNRRPAKLSGICGSFWKESRNQEPGHVVGLSVRTALRLGTPRKRSAMRKLILLIALVTMAGVASADDKGKGGDKSNGKVKVYDFSGDTIEGDL